MRIVVCALLVAGLSGCAEGLPDGAAGTWDDTAGGAAYEQEFLKGPHVDDCTFGVNAACDLTYHDYTHCKEKPNKDGPGVVEDIKRMHCSALPDFCGQGTGDIDVVRICLPGGGGQPTECGLTGPRGCAVCSIEAECH